jgi:hypothetical protein
VNCGSAATLVVIVFVKAKDGKTIVSHQAGHCLKMPYLHSEAITPPLPTPPFHPDIPMVWAT